MKILWNYISPLRGRVVLALVLAGIAQILDLVDPLILGRIIDDYALNPAGRTGSELVGGVLGGLALVIAVLLPSIFRWQSNGRALIDRRVMRLL